MSCCNACAQGLACGAPVPERPPFSFGVGPMIAVDVHGRPLTMAGSFTASGPLSSCAALPWMPERIELSVRRRWSLGQTDPERLTNTILVELYPRTHEGVQVPWASLPSDAATCLLELRRLVLFQIRAVVALLDFEAARTRYGSVGGGV